MFHFICNSLSHRLFVIKTNESSHFRLFRIKTEGGRAFEKQTKSAVSEIHLFVCFGERIKDDKTVSDPDFIN